MNSDIRFIGLVAVGTVVGLWLAAKLHAHLSSVATATVTQ